METAFYSIGILSILYYVCIAVYTKNWKSTFSWFWIVFGALQFVLGAVTGMLPGWMQLFVQIMTGAVFLFFLGVEAIILSGMLTIPKKNLDVIIILGACLKGSRITGSLKRRLDRALAYLNENPDTIAVVSGGRGRGEDVTEASAMRAYLLQCGVEEERVLMEEKSKSTKENLEFSRELLKRSQKKIGIVTNNFHIYRAVKLAEISGYEKVRGIAAGCDLVLFLNYLVREFFAVVWMYVKYTGKSGKERIDK